MTAQLKRYGNTDVFLEIKQNVLKTTHPRHTHIRTHAHTALKSS